MLPFLSRLLHPRVQRHPVFFPLLWLALWLLLTLPWRPLAMPDEGRYANVALEMARTGNWAVPLINDLPFFHKPPLFYWITAAAIQTFGNYAWASRLASALGAWLMGAGLFLFVRRHASARLAQGSLLVLATLPLYFGAAQYVNLDMLVASMISLTILAAVHAVLQEDQGLPCRPWVWLAYALAALGLLAKGLIGLVLPGAVVVVWLLWMRHWRGLWLLVSLPGLALLLAVGLPWFLLMEQRYPGFLHYFFVYQHFQRFAESGFNNEHAFWFYVPVLLGLSLPWSWWGLVAAWRAWQGRTGQEADAGRAFCLHTAPLQGRTALLRLCVVWLLLVVLFFSLPRSKLVGYVLPVLPAWALLLGMALASVRRRVADVQTHAAWRNAGAAAAVCLASMAAIALFRPAPGHEAALHMQAQFQPQDQLVMLDEFDPDVSYYLNTRRPAWVVAAFDDSNAVHKDTWRKELWDAGQFDPALSRQTLLPFNQLQPRLCDALAQNATLWVQGSAADAARHFPALGLLQPFWQREDGKDPRTIWRLPGRSALAAAGCLGP